MPFDTTYHYFSANENAASTYIKPGGKEVHIYLRKGEKVPITNADDQMLHWIDSAEQTNSQQTFDKQYPAKESYTPDAPMVILFIVLTIVGLAFARHLYLEGKAVRPRIKFTKFRRRPANYLKYYGDELDFSDEILVSILMKHFPYFKLLNEDDRKRFLRRINNFIDDKTFLIHGGSGFREMPVLISAAAIQLTFGLQKYLLPNFTRIHIYPQEYVSAATLHIIEGNVQGKTINFSWKHFLDGYNIPDNGQNVGLHEMSHALFYQNFVTDENVDFIFENSYHEFTSHGTKAYQNECAFTSGLYTAYAKTNFQEFWAESVELFFEKPTALRSQYPELYNAMREVLNQDPANNITCFRQRSLATQLRQLLSRKVN